MRESLPNRSDKNAAAAVGRAIAARAKSASIDAVHFEKPRGKRFHGKLKALIDNMREAGLPLNFTHARRGGEVIKPNARERFHTRTFIYVVSVGPRTIARVS